MCSLFVLTVRAHLILFFFGFFNEVFLHSCATAGTAAPSSRTHSSWSTAATTGTTLWATPSSSISVSNTDTSKKSRTIPVLAVSPRDQTLRCRVPLCQIPTTGQRWRYPSSLPPGRGTPSSPWRRPPTSLSRAGLCWFSEAETTRACSTPTWPLWLSRTCWRRCRRSEVKNDSCGVVLTHS